MLASRDGVLVVEFPRERFPKNAAKAVLGCLRKPPPVATFDSEDLRNGVSGLERSGFITWRRRGPIDSRKLSPCAKGLGQLSMLTLSSPPSKSGVLPRDVITGASATDFRVVSSLHFRASIGRIPFSLMDSWDSPSSSRRRRLRMKNMIKAPISTRPAIAPDRPPIIACLRSELPLDTAVALVVADGAVADCSVWCGLDPEVVVDEDLPVLLVTISGRVVCLLVAVVVDCWHESESPH